jgi:hypothetical protein
MTVPYRHSGERRNPASLYTHHVMAGLDPAISRQRQMRGSSPRMTYYKKRHGRTSQSVIRGLDPRIF